MHHTSKCTYALSPGPRVKFTAAAATANGSSWSQYQRTARLNATRGASTTSYVQDTASSMATALIGLVTPSLLNTSTTHPAADRSPVPIWLIWYCTCAGAGGGGAGGGVGGAGGGVGPAGTTQQVAHDSAPPHAGQQAQLSQGEAQPQVELVHSMAQLEPAAHKGRAASQT